MKSYFYIGVIAFVMTLLSSCDRENTVDEFAIPVNPTIDDGLFSYTMQFNSTYPHYDGEDATRATSTGEWEDGDVIYLFLGGENEAYANAIYDKEHNCWTLHSDKKLEACNVSNCSVWYGKGSGKKTITDEVIEFDYLTEAYLTEAGHYYFNNGEFVVSALLKPFAKRLRFKGTPGTSVKVQGDGRLVYYNKIFVSGVIGFGLCDDKNWDLKVNEDGYTDYRMFFSDASLSKLKTISPVSLKTYTRDFSLTSLQDGESGCISVPTEERHAGWACGHEWAYDYVDLGLPSGTLWATCNVGAFSPEENGFYFAWGETESKQNNSYDWNSYKWSYGSYDMITKYGTSSEYGTVDDRITLDLEDDAASMNWGEIWRMPTVEEQAELINICTWRWTIQNGVKGYKVIGRNGNSIYLPCAGRRENSNLINEQKTGYYWANSIDTSRNYYAHYIIFDADGKDHNHYLSRCSGCPVRPVLK